MNLPDLTDYGTLPEQVRWVLEGDKEKADMLRGLGLQIMGQLKGENVNDFAQYYKRVNYKDGVIIQVQRQKQIFVDLYTISIFYPPRTEEQPQPEQVVIPELKKGQFYWIPGCKARYDLASKWTNNIPNGELKDEGVQWAVGSEGITPALNVIRRKSTGLPIGGTSPDGLFARDYNVAELPGDDTTVHVDNFTSGMLFSTAHIPTSGAFSLSCIVKLNKAIEIDYSFSKRTDLSGAGYTIYNPFKPRVLHSDDGITWSATCPGSFAPLLGKFSVSRFSDHYVNVTLPWPDYNDNFLDTELQFIGYREINTTCPNEPLLESAYSGSSPYWDKVPTGSLGTLNGSFSDWREENTEINNLKPYASYCKFTVPIPNDPDDPVNQIIENAHVGTRVVGTTLSGEMRYATVSAKEKVGGNAIFILKDYQHKLYIKDSEDPFAVDGQPLVFGSQPFPLCHPQGYMMGMSYLGLHWYNGNRILAGKINDFQTEYQYGNVISAPLELGVYYHVCMTYGDTGEVSLYITKQGDKTTYVTKGQQPTSDFYNFDDSGKILDVHSGGGAFILRQLSSSFADYTKWYSAWTFSANMEIAMMRFYHRELSADEAQLLVKEVFDGIFVADDFEAAQLVGNGHQPIQV